MLLHRHPQAEMQGAPGFGQLHHHPRATPLPEQLFAQRPVARASCFFHKLRRRGSATARSAQLYRRCAFCSCASLKWTEKRCAGSAAASLGAWAAAESRASSATVLKYQRQCSLLQINRSKTQTEQRRKRGRHRRICGPPVRHVVLSSPSSAVTARSGGRSSMPDSTQTTVLVLPSAR
jgi:hypothetical protein